MPYLLREPNAAVCLRLNGFNDVSTFANDAASCIVGDSQLDCATSRWFLMVVLVDCFQYTENALLHSSSTALDHTGASIAAWVQLLFLRELDKGAGGSL